MIWHCPAVYSLVSSLYNQMSSIYIGVGGGGNSMDSLVSSMNLFEVAYSGHLQGAASGFAFVLAMNLTRRNREKERKKKRKIDNGVLN